MEDKAGEDDSEDDLSASGRSAKARWSRRSLHKSPLSLVTSPLLRMTRKKRRRKRRKKRRRTELDRIATSFAATREQSAGAYVKQPQTNSEHLMSGRAVAGARRKRKRRMTTIAMKRRRKRQGLEVETTAALIHRGS